jgi:tungstate transport system substrate-binding protein
MGQTLTIASEKGAYTIADRGTFLAQQGNLDLTIQAQGYQNFLNVYHVLVVNPEKSTSINVDGARAFADFIVAPDTQTAIGQFGLEKFGQPLFFPAAAMTDADLGV